MRDLNKKNCDDKCLIQCFFLIQVFPLVVHKIQSLVKECIAIRSTISSQMRDVPKSRRLLLVSLSQGHLTYIKNALMSHFQGFKLDIKLLVTDR